MRPIADPRACPTFDGADSRFNGERTLAVKRLRELVDLACERLTAGRLNFASFNLKIHLDDIAGVTSELGVSPNFMKDLEAEREAMKRRRLVMIDGKRRKGEPDHFRATQAARRGSIAVVAASSAGAAE